MNDLLREAFVRPRRTVRIEGMYRIDNRLSAPGVRPEGPGGPHRPGGPGGPGGPGWPGEPDDEGRPLGPIIPPGRRPREGNHDEGPLQRRQRQAAPGEHADDAVLARVSTFFQLT